MINLAIASLPGELELCSNVCIGGVNKAKDMTSNMDGSSEGILRSGSCY